MHIINNSNNNNNNMRKSGLDLWIEKNFVVNIHATYKEPNNMITDH